MGLNFSIEEAKAEMWVREVNYQIDIAEEILQDISRDCYVNPNEDDTILRGINDVAEKASETWNGVINAFKGVGNFLTKTLAFLKKAVEGSMDAVEDAASVFH